jgi:hypothetical protein
LSKEETPIEKIKYTVHQVEDSLMLDEFCMTMPWQSTTGGKNENEDNENTVKRDARANISA